MVGGALTLVVCILFVLLWLIVVIVCGYCVAGPGKYGMLGHGPGSPRSRGVVFGTTRKIQYDEDDWWEKRKCTFV